jgi:hypothetical protein
MTVSIALFIQIINFIVAYIIIRTLLLKPAVSEILQEEEHQARLQEAIDNTIKGNKEKEQTIESKWVACRNVFAKKSPGVIQIENESCQPSQAEFPELHETDSKEIAHMAQSITDNIVERIRHVE